MAYIVVVSIVSVLLGVLALRMYGPPPWAPLLLLVGMGVLSFNLREPDVGSRISISFLSVILLASAVIVGPFGAWLVGVLSVVSDLRQVRWYQGVYNMAMCAVVGVMGGLTYRATGGSIDLTGLFGASTIGLRVGMPLVVADVVACVTNAVLLGGVMRVDRGHPFVNLVRRMLATTGPAYIGYGVIGFLFVVLWFPARLGPVSALFIMAPLLVARWAFIQYGDEMRAHERTIDTLVTALGTKLPHAVPRSRRSAQLAEWIAEELGLPPQQAATARYVAMLHEIGNLGVHAEVADGAPATDGSGGRPGPGGHAAPGVGGGTLVTRRGNRRALPGRAVLGARMIDGIEFLEPARSGIEHQCDRFDGRDGTLAGTEIPIAARIVAVASRFEELSRLEGDPIDALGAVDAEIGRRFDPSVVAALRASLDRHAWPPADGVEIEGSPR